MSGSLTVGSLSGPFGSVGGGTARGDDFIDAATMFTATAGAGFPLRSTSRTQFCPFIAALLINGMHSNSPVRVGDNIYPTHRLSSQAYGLGATVGSALSAVTAFELVPFVSAAVIGRTTTIYFPSGPTHTEGDHYYAVSLGAGAVVERLLTLRPAMTLSLAEGRATVSYGVRVSISFGRVTQPPPNVDEEGSLTTVWVNTQAKVYYCPDARSYGASPEGAFMTEREALAIGAVPAYGRRCKTDGK